MDWYAKIFKFCGALCHQMPSRSFLIAGYQFPLCYRCTGLLVGTIAFLFLIYRNRLLSFRLTILLLLPMLIDVGLQAAGLWESTNGLRLATGIGFGMGMPTIALKILSRHNFHKRGAVHESQTNH